MPAGSCELQREPESSQQHLIPTSLQCIPALCKGAVWLMSRSLDKEQPQPRGWFPCSHILLLYMENIEEGLRLCPLGGSCLGAAPMGSENQHCEGGTSSSQHTVSRHTGMRPFPLGKASSSTLHRGIHYSKGLRVICCRY